MGKERFVAPTLERERHSSVEMMPQAIPDIQGVPSQPYRDVGLLLRMERRGAITAEMRQAGEDFRSRFYVAQLDPLKAADYTRSMVSGKISLGPNARIENARESVWSALLAVGGPHSAGGSCLWHVIGWERPLKEWALEQGWSGRRVSQEAASGILIATLGTLEAHYKNRAS